MCDTFSAAFDHYMNMLCLVALFWIVLSIAFYICGNPSKKTQLSIITHYGLQQAPLHRGIEDSTFGVTTPLSTTAFNPMLSSTPHPPNGDVTSESQAPTPGTSNDAPPSCNPGRVTINPWFNFLRYFRRTHCGIRQAELLQRASQVWRNMSDVEKEPYREEATFIRNTRGSESDSE